MSHLTAAQSRRTQPQSMQSHGWRSLQLVRMVRPVFISVFIGLFLCVQSSGADSPQARNPNVTEPSLVPSNTSIVHGPSGSADGGPSVSMSVSSETVTVTASISATGSVSSSALVPGTSSFTATSVAPSASAAFVTVEAKTKVLMLGDSMVHAGLSHWFRPKLKGLGATWAHDSKISAATGTYAYGDRLHSLLKQHQPDVVLVVLGSNMVAIPYPKVYVSQIKRIVEKIHHGNQSRKCIWIGPPTWSKETGIVAVFREHTAPCQFFDSGTLKLERQRDKIHPTIKGGATWAEAIWNQYMQAPNTSQ